MGRARAVDVTIVGNAASLKRALAQSEGHLKSLERSAKTAATGFAAFYLGGAVIRGLEGVAKAAMDSQANMRVLANTVQNSGISWKAHGKAIEDHLKSMGLSRGFMEGPMVMAFNRLIVSTHSTKKAFGDLALAQDLSRSRGMELQQAALLIAKTHQGNVTALKRLGIAVVSVTTQVDALKAAHDRGIIAGGKYSKAQMIEYHAALAAAKAHDKAASAIGTLTLLHQQFGGASEKYSRTAAGGFAKFQAAVEQTKIAIGNALLPTLGRLANDGVRWAGDISRAYGKHRTLFKEIGVAVLIFAGAITTYITATKIAIATQALWNATMAANPIGLVVTAIALLAGALIYLYGHNKRVHAIMLETWNWMKANIPPIVERIKQVIVQVWGTIGPTVKAVFDNVKQIFVDALRVIKDTVNLIGDVFHGRWSKVWSDAKTLATDALKGIKDWMTGLPAILGDLALKAAEALARGFLHGLQGLAAKAASMIPGASLFTGANNAATVNVGAHSKTGIRPHAATGGMVAGVYSRGDVVPAMLSGGEAVLNPQQIAMVGKDRVMGALAATGAPTIGHGGSFAGGAGPNFDWNHPTFGGSGHHRGHGRGHGRGRGRGHKPPPPPDPKTAEWLKMITSWIEHGHTPHDLLIGGIDEATTILDTTQSDLDQARFLHPKNPDQRLAFSDAKAHLSILHRDAKARERDLSGAPIPRTDEFRQKIKALENQLTIDRNKKKPEKILHADHAKIRRAYDERAWYLRKLLAKTKNPKMRKRIQAELDAAQSGSARNAEAALAPTDPFGIDGIHHKILADEQAIAATGSIIDPVTGAPYGTGTGAEYATAVADTRSLISTLQGDISSGKFTGANLDTLNADLTSAYGTLTGFESSAASLGASGAAGSSSSSSGVISPDAQAQINKLNHQVSVANYSAGIANAQFGVLTGSGDIGMGGRNAMRAASGGPNIIINTLLPSDPNTLMAIGNAATKGQALQPFITSPRLSANI